VAPVSRDDLTRFERALERQGTTGALVGVVDEPGQTVDLDGEAVRGARANLVHMEPTASPDAVAEAIAFLASPRSHSVDRATIPVGAAPP
jgi:NAD(P)-dependent dehydrogenase (short-subunit alcohol dehydrogenase family)